MTTDEHTNDCGHAWCKAHRQCDCAYAEQYPHRAVGCRYTRDESGEFPHFPERRDPDADDE